MGQVKDFLEYIFSALKIWVIIQPWEMGLRVRMGNKIKVLKPGIYFKIPYFDSVFVQEVRLRIADMPVQTITTKDLKTISIVGAIGYSITDINKLYNTLFHPETSVRNIAMSIISTQLYEKESSEINPKQIEIEVLKALNDLDYGLTFKHFKITNFAIVRTLRLIRDTNWGFEGLKMDQKK